MGRMMENNHTPGPWMAASAISSVVGLPVVAQKGRLICNVNHAHDPLHGKVSGDDAFNREALSNARLIAAAPDLVEALLSLLKLHEPHHNSIEHAAARKALTKAGV